MPPRQHLNSPIERDLDALRICGLRRLAHGGITYEALPQIALFQHLVDMNRERQPQARLAVIESIAVRALVQLALEHSGTNREASALSELYGLGSGPDQSALAQHYHSERQPTDLVLREIAAAVAYGDVSVPHFRQKIARYLLIPELARAILEADAEHTGPTPSTLLGVPAPAVPTSRRGADRELLQAVGRYYPGLRKIETLVEAIRPDRPPYTDVTATCTLSDGDTPGEYNLRIRLAFTATMTDYVLAVVSRAVVADILIAECPRISNFYTCSTERGSTSANLLPVHSVFRVHENATGRAVQIPVELSRVPPSDCDQYLGSIPPEVAAQVELYHAQLSEVPQTFRLVSTISSPMQRSDHYCYWVADRPMYIRTIEFDTANFSTGDRGLTFQPFLGSLAFDVRNMGGYRVDLENWILRDQGAMLVW